MHRAAVSPEIELNFSDDSILQDETVASFNPAGVYCAMQTFEMHVDVKCTLMEIDLEQVNLGQVGSSN